MLLLCEDVPFRSAPWDKRWAGRSPGWQMFCSSSFVLVGLDQLMVSTAGIEEEQGWVLGTGHQSEKRCNILNQT